MGTTTSRSPGMITNKSCEIIEKKAYELYESRGMEQGNDLDEWLEAERLVNAARKA